MPRIKKEKLRIAMLGHKRVPSREGGVEIVVGELATRMAQAGHQVTLYNRKGHHVSGAAYDKRSESEYRGVRLKTVWTVNRRGVAAMIASALASVRAAFGRYDVVHFHAEGPCATLWIPKLFGKKCIATVHGLDHQRAKWGRLAAAYIRIGEKCLARYADEIIVLSEHVKQYFKDTYQRETIFIPNGVARPALAEADEITQRFGLEKDQYVLYLGRLVPEKGITYLIEAFRQVKTDKVLVIAGGSSDSSEYEEELRQMTDDDPKVIFTGFVEGKLLAELYSNAYLYVLPSDLEGMPLSLLEAMSYGNCCLTSDISECADVTGEFGLTFAQGDVEDLKAQLQKLCDEPHTVASYKAQAADYICRKYNWNQVAGQTLKLYGVEGAIASTASVEEETNESLAHQ